MNTPNKKVGRPRAYTPEALDAKFEEYVEWVKANPVHHPVVAESAISASALSNLTHQTNGSTGMYHYARARHSQ